MSDFSLSLVLHFKASKIINDRAKVIKKTENSEEKRENSVCIMKVYNEFHKKNPRLAQRQIEESNI